jgi:ribosomal-protein-alanine N-acetyltransferase
VPPTQLYIDYKGEAVGDVGFTQEADIERCTAEVGYWLGESRYCIDKSIRIK